MTAAPSRTPRLASCSRRARVRTRNRPERGVTGGSARMNATRDSETADTARSRYGGRTRDAATRRPVTLGPRTHGEWTWTLVGH
ncbi:hypothetical protein MBEHAL_0354 [Halarchaeum acidiphilum MH1-52-1]|uniref:Uncharacterized protein n=1 Tax=Halarchaeum acidiphilum MH1-52-1 TaxID=1261545 RepID=U3A1R6_9EURY|nr:hypothetical protein MBEHAL_0354 [Halarchaeum acidiphilum MH1-52-1]